MKRSQACSLDEGRDRLPQVRDCFGSRPKVSQERKKERKRERERERTDAKGNF